MIDLTSGKEFTLAWKYVILNDEWCCHQSHLFVVKEYISSLSRSFTFDKKCNAKSKEVWHTYNHLLRSGSKFFLGFGFFLAVTVLFLKLWLFLQSQKALNNYLNDPFDIGNNGKREKIFWGFWKSDFFILLLSELYNPDRQQINGVY